MVDGYAHSFEEGLHTGGCAYPPSEKKAASEQANGYLQR